MSRIQFLTEFKPSLVFLVKFVALYLIGNVLYGLFVTYYHPEADPVTRWVTDQSSAALHVFGFQTEVVPQPNKPNVILLLDGKGIISVYEGCNGLNIMIVFTAFLLAFGPLLGRTLLFWVCGTLLIHVANLVRVTVLFWVALAYPSSLYFLHKYFFTGFLYLIVFILWYVWIVPARPKANGKNV